MGCAPLTQLAQSVERQPFKLVVEGSSPSLGGGKADAFKSVKGGEMEGMCLKTGVRVP